MIDTIAHQLTNVTLIRKKSHHQKVQKLPAHNQSCGLVGIKHCSFCCQPGHGAKKCSANQNGNNRCDNFRKLGDGVETCLSRPNLLTASEKQVGGNHRRVATSEYEESKSDSLSSFSDEDYKHNNFLVILDEAATEDQLPALKRRADCQPFPKDPRTDGQSSMNVNNLLKSTSTALTVANRKITRGEKKPGV